YPMDATGDRLWTAFTKTNANLVDLESQIAGFSPTLVPIGPKDARKGIPIDIAFGIINANFTQAFNLVGTMLALTILNAPPVPLVIAAGDAAAFLKININFTYLYAFHPFPGNYLVDEFEDLFITET